MVILLSKPCLEGKGVKRSIQMVLVPHGFFWNECKKPNPWERK